MSKALTNAARTMCSRTVARTLTRTYASAPLAAHPTQRLNASSSSLSSLFQPRLPVYGPQAPHPFTLLAPPSLHFATAASVRASASSPGCNTCDCADTPKPQTSSACWACPVRHSCTMFCQSCGAIQPPATSNPFELFELPETFNVDIAQLETRFKALQRRVHPDRFSCKSEQEQEYSSAQASLINNAYRTLYDPLSRARYLLLRDAPELAEEGSATQRLSPETLMEIMELREEIADTESPEALIAIYKRNEKAVDRLVETMADAFSRKDFKSAATAAAEITYNYSIAEELKSRIPGTVFEAHGIALNKMRCDVHHS